jgi:adenylate kinase family enzyme
MKDVIIISGAPGSGKTTVAKLLKEKLQSPYVDLGWLREFHLDREWKQANEKEERMSFENLVSILKNYIKNDYRNVIVTDLRDSKVREIPRSFEKDNFIIFSLTIETDEELQKRVLGERDSGFKNVEEALRWNKDLKKRQLLPNEHKIDNSHNDPGKTVQEILKLI